MPSNSDKLPEAWLKMLEWVCPRHSYEEIEGDLLQKFNRDIKKFGETRARRRLIWNVIRFFRPGILLRNKLQVVTNKNFMVHSHVKIAVRQATGNRTFSIVNVMGLTIGITIALMTLQLILFEYSFEDFNRDADRTYRINLYNTQNGVFDKISPGTVSGLAYSMKQMLSGAGLIARIGDRTNAVVSDNGDHLTDKEEIVFADPEIVRILGLVILYGDATSVLQNPQSIIISESSARKYFSKTDVVGQILQIGFSGATIERKSYEVKGVFRDIPANTHQHFEFVLPPANEQFWNENWSWSNVSTYIQLESDTKPDDLKSGLSRIVKEHHTDSISDKYLLEPIKDIRLHALDGTGRAAINNFFMMLGVIVIALGWFNYVNLSTARFFERMREVGVRKIIGASRTQLIFQLLVESFLFNAIAFFGALIIFYISWPQITSLLAQEIPITLLNIRNVISGIGFVVLSALVSGIYPAFFLSRFKPLQSLKGKVTNGMDRTSLRKALVTSQFAISILLLTAVLVVQRQISFMRDQDIGLSIDQSLIIEEPLLTDATTVNKFELVKQQLLQIPGVKGVTYASSFPGAEIDWHRTDITLNEENADFRYESRIISIGTEFLDVFELPLQAGRNFNDKIEGDKKAMLISEAASKMFGFTELHQALGKIIFIGSRRFEIIGVVKDHHYRSLQSEIQPVVYMQGYPRNPRYAIKISSQLIAESIPKIEATWKAAYSPNVFKYYFLDDFFNRQYTMELQLANIVTALTLVAIFICCSGLFALSLYSVGRRAKEISIRKVFGATIMNVSVLLSQHFLKLLLFGAFIALPLGYLGARFWLQGYAYKMSLEIWLFLIPVGLVLILAIATTGFQTISAAKKNPVDNMKSE